MYRQEWKYSPQDYYEEERQRWQKKLDQLVAERKQWKAQRDRELQAEQQEIEETWKQIRNEIESRIDPGLRQRYHQARQRLMEIQEQNDKAWEALRTHDEMGADSLNQTEWHQRRVALISHIQEVVQAYNEAETEYHAARAVYRTAISTTGYMMLDEARTQLTELEREYRTRISQLEQSCNDLSSALLWIRQTM